MPFDIDPRYTETLTTTQILRDAADYLEAHKWAQGNGFCDDRGVCVLGAVALGDVEVASRIHSVEDPTYRALKEYLGNHPVFWNDAPERTKEQVVFALRGCADAVSS